MKLINNALFAAQIGLVAEGVRLGGLLGVSEPALLEALTHGSAAAARWAISRGRARPRPSSTPSATSSARTSPWSAKTVAELGGDLGALNEVVDAGASRQ